MKKAKEYAQKYKANPTNQTLVEILKEMVIETKEIYNMRHARSDEALIAIFNEQDGKWRSFVSLTGDPSIRRDGLKEFCQKHFPEIYVTKELLKKGNPFRR